MTTYITRTIPAATITEYKEIIRILLKADIPDYKIQTKGGGTQVKFKDIPHTTITSIYEYLKKVMELKEKKLESLTEYRISNE